MPGRQTTEYSKALSACAVALAQILTCVRLIVTRCSFAKSNLPGPPEQPLSVGADCGSPRGYPPGTLALSLPVGFPTNVLHVLVWFLLLFF